MKIVGGTTATANSWPSIAYVKWNYQGTYRVSSGASVTYSFSAACGGTLIDRQTILTAAHCIPSTVSFTYAGVSYTGQVYTNSYYPTIASMFTVYLGLQDKTSIDSSGTYSAPTVKMAVSCVVKVF